MAVPITGESPYLVDQNRSPELPIVSASARILPSHFHPEANNTTRKLVPHSFLRTHGASTNNPPLRAVTKLLKTFGAEAANSI
jgi:hypothetical protein